ncbi:MAG: hypothetical protein JKX81_15975 [Arenicella sp.]|nr:hypothetical protein [Arenicella sp.]
MQKPFTTQSELLVSASDMDTEALLDWSQIKRDRDAGSHVKHDSRENRKSTYGFSVHTRI